MLDVDNGWAWTNSARLLRTTDGGQTWTDRTPAGQVMSDGFFPLDAQAAWLSIYLQDSNRFGLLHTVDGGQTWAEYPYGPASALHFTDSLNGWAEPGEGAAGSIYYFLSLTRDGGKTWRAVPVIPPYPDASLPAGGVHLSSTDSFYYDPARMLAVFGDMITMQARGSVRLQVSLDLGKTWTAQNLPLPENYQEALVNPYRAVFFNDNSGLLPVSLVKMNNDGSFVYQRLVFYSSRDNGASWKLAPGGLNAAQYTQMQILSPRDIFVLCGSALCASQDGAQTWSTVASNLDFSQSGSRSVSALDFVDSQTGWVVIQENETSTLYKTSNAGVTWELQTPKLAASTPVTVSVDASIPTPTPIPMPTLEPTPTQDVSFEARLNATRLRFAPNGTWMEINDTIAAKASKQYVLSALQGQIMSVSIPQGPAFTVEVAGADKKPLSDPKYTQPFWRGGLPSTQDYIVTVSSQAGGAFSLRVAINPPGQATQDFWYFDGKIPLGISYTDEFAPTDLMVPVNVKGTRMLTLAFIDPAFYSPKTNLIEATLVLAATRDPAIVASCTQPSTQVAETVTGQVKVNNYTFTRSEFSGAAAGNRYDQIAYRTVWSNNCIELVFLIHSANIANYPAGTVVEYDQAALLNKFEAILNSFIAK